MTKDSKIQNLFPTIIKLQPQAYSQNRDGGGGASIDNVTKAKFLIGY